MGPRNALAAVLWLAVLAEPTLACSCIARAWTMAELEAEGYQVLSGVVIDTESSQPGMRAYSFSTLEGILRLETPASGAACDVQLPVGHDTKVLVRGPEPDDSYRIGLCAQLWLRQAHQAE